MFAAFLAADYGCLYLRHLLWRKIGSRFFMSLFPKTDKEKSMEKGFTLIELLVVVLIIGILSAVALPQYTKAVEKARMTEAVVLVRAIANANQLYYMANGEYAGIGDLELLDINVPGTTFSWAGNRIQTKDFIYSPKGAKNEPHLALAHRKPMNQFYYIWISREEPNKIKCTVETGASSIQKQLCKQLDQNGTL